MSGFSPKITISGAGAFKKLNLSRKALNIAKPLVEDLFDDIIDAARDNLERNKSIVSAALTDSLGKKIYITETPKGFFLMAYVGIDGDFRRAWEGSAKAKVPAAYAALVEYGNPNHNSRAKPFLRPALASTNAEARVKKILEQSMEKSTEA